MTRYGKIRKPLIAVLAVIASLLLILAGVSFSQPNSETVQALVTTKSTSLPAELKGLFKDYTLTTVADEYNTLDKLYELKNSLDEKSDYNTYFERAEKIIKGEIRFEEDREFSTKSNAKNKIEQYGDTPSYSLDELYFSWRSSDLQSTGIYGLTGDTITIFVEATDGAVLPEIMLCQSHGDYQTYRDKVILTRGVNIFTFPFSSTTGDRGGAIYFVNGRLPDEQHGEVNIYIEGGGFYPLYKQGDDEQVFIESLKEYEALRESNGNMLDFGEVQADNILITMQSSTMYNAYVNNGASPAENLDKWQEYIRQTFEFNGIATSPESTYGQYYNPMTDHVRINFRYMTMYQPNIAAYSYTYFFAFAEEHMWFADYNDSPEDYCFLLGHEVGHIVDTVGRKLAETTNNVNAMFSILYSVGAFTVGKDKIPYADVQAALFSDYTLTYNGQDKTNHMLWWVLETVKPGYWARLNNCYRNNEPYNSGMNTTERMVYYSSLIFEVDLGEYFERWGATLITGRKFTVSDASSAYLTQMQQAKESDKIHKDESAKYWYADEEQCYFTADLPQRDPQYNGNTPTISVSKDGSTRTIKITSRADSNLLGYEVLSSIDGGINYKVAGFTYTTSFTDTYNYGTEPTYKVRAFNRFFFTSDYSEPVNETSGEDQVKGVCRIENDYYSTLSDAIKAAKENDTIYLLYDVSVGSLALTKSITIAVDPSATSDVVIRRSGSTYFFQFGAKITVEFRGSESAKIVFDGMNQESTFAAILLQYGALKASNVTFRNLIAKNDAGAITVTYANLELENCTFENCSSQAAGAIRFSDYSNNTYTFKNCIFKKNYTRGGDFNAAVVLGSSNATILEGCTFENNEIADIYLAGNVTFAGTIPNAKLNLSEATTIALSGVKNPEAELENISIVDDEYVCKISDNSIVLEKALFTLTFDVNGRTVSLLLHRTTFTFGEEVLGELLGENQYIVCYSVGSAKYYVGDTIQVRDDMSFTVVIKDMIRVTLCEDGNEKIVYVKNGEILYLPRYDSKNRKVVNWINANDSFYAGSGYVVSDEIAFYAVYLGSFTYLYCIDGIIADYGYAKYGQSINTLTGVDGVAFWRVSSALVSVGETYSITKDTVFYAVAQGEEENVIDLSESKIEISDADFTYNGKEIKPNITVTVNGVVISAENYLVTYTNNVNAGTATITITARGGNAVGTQSINFEIKKASRTVTATIEGWTYNEQANTPMIAWNGEDGIATVLYKADGDSDYRETIPFNAGKYTVKIIISETQNYEKKELILELIIEKAERPSFDKEQNVTVDSDKATLNDIAEILPSDWTWQNGNATITDGMDAIAVYIGSDSENYKTIEITIHITVLDDVEPDPEQSTDPEEGQDGNGSETDPDQPQNPEEGNFGENSGGGTPSEGENSEDKSNKDDNTSMPNDSQNNEENDDIGSGNAVNVGIAVIVGVGTTGVGIGTAGLIILFRRRKRL